MNNKKNDLNWIDILKGIGIVSVVIGHVFNGVLSDFIYMYHMPLFFFISGFLYKVPVDSVKFLKKKVFSLLVPYSIFLIVLYSPTLIKSFVNYTDVIENVTALVFGGARLGGFTGVFWFVTCLFLTQQLFTVVIKYDSKPYIMMIVFLVLSYLNQYFFANVKFPWAANVVLASMPIFYVGYLYKSVTNDFIFLNVILCLLGAILLYLDYDVYYNMKFTNYGMPIISFVVAIACSLLIVKISKLMEQSIFFKMLFGNLGKASLVIMFLHQPVQITIDLILGIEDQTIRFLFALLIPYLAYIIFKRNWFTRVYLLGEYGLRSHKQSRCTP